MSLRRSLTIAVAATLLAACTMVPEYQRPAAPVPTAIPNATSTTAGTADLATVAWRDYFGDDRLRALIDVALALRNGPPGQRDLGPDREPPADDQLGQGEQHPVAPTTATCASPASTSRGRARSTRSSRRTCTR